MKKRTVKDFIALYAPEDEEKLVLIQDGVSADKTFLDTYWAAHTHALAMADVQTGQAISGRCYLSWPLTDKERDAGDYSKRFTKGQIYRIKARGWKGDALYECARLIKKQREVFGSGYRKKPQNMTRTAALRFRNTQKRSRANKNRIQPTGTPRTRNVSPGRFLFENLSFSQVKSRRK